MADPAIAPTLKGLLEPTFVSNPSQVVAPMGPGVSKVVTPVAPVATKKTAPASRKSTKGKRAVKRMRARL